MKDKYTTAEIAVTLSANIRSIQRQLATLRDTFSPDGNTYDYKVIDLLNSYFKYDSNDIETTVNDKGRQFDRTEYFTEAEYQEFHKRLVEYPLLLNKINLLLSELDFHKRYNQWHKDQQIKLIESIKERNFIEEKRFDQ